MFGRGLLKEHFCKRFVKISAVICSDIAIKANFHSPHYKSVLTLSCNSNNGNKNVIFVEANAINISVKFQLFPPYGF